MGDSQYQPSRDFTKVRVRALPKVSPPIPEGGGRLFTPAGELAQVVNGSLIRFLAYIEFQKNDLRPRGNHYHVKKVELLYIVSGRLRACYRDLDDGNLISMVLKAGDIVEIEPRCAHVYYAAEHTQALEFSSEPYDPTDTIPFTVEANA